MDKSVRSGADSLFFLFSTLQYSSVLFSTLQYSSVLFSTLQYSSVQISLPLNRRWTSSKVCVYLDVVFVDVSGSLLVET